MNDISICPYCGKKMELGYIPQGRVFLKWIPEENDKSPLLNWFPKGIKLTDWESNGTVESFYCNGCEKIIIDTKDKVNQNA